MRGAWSGVPEQVIAGAAMIVVVRAVEAATVPVMIAVVVAMIMPAMAVPMIAIAIATNAANRQEVTRSKIGDADEGDFGIVRQGDGVVAVGHLLMFQGLLDLVIAIPLQVDLIGALGKVQDRIRPTGLAVVEHKPIRVEPGRDRRRTSARDKRVLASTAGDLIGTRAAVEYCCNIRITCKT